MFCETKNLFSLNLLPRMDDDMTLEQFLKM